MLCCLSPCGVMAFPPAMVCGAVGRFLEGLFFFSHWRRMRRCLAARCSVEIGDLFFLRIRRVVVEVWFEALCDSCYYSWCAISTTSRYFLPCDCRPFVPLECGHMVGPCTEEVEAFDRVQVNTLPCALRVSCSSPHRYAL